MCNLIRFTKKFTSPSTPNLNSSRCEPRAEFLSLDLWREIPPHSQGEPGEVYIGLISTLFSKSCRCVAMNSPFSERMNSGGLPCFINSGCSASKHRSHSFWAALLRSAHYGYFHLEPSAFLSCAQCEAHREQSRWPRCGWRCVARSLTKLNPRPARGFGWSRLSLRNTWPQCKSATIFFKRSYSFLSDFILETCERERPQNVLRQK